MVLNVSLFHRIVVADTCSVWNILSARVLHGAAIAAGCCISLTEFGLYECLYKTRAKPTAAGKELQRRLVTAQQQGQFKAYPLDVEDLQDVAILENRQRLRKGELAAIAFAIKTRQAFLTDDQGARVLAAMVMEPGMVQTTPHLLGWLVYIDQLGDSEIDGLVAEHVSFERPLKPYLMEMYREGLRCRLLAAGQA